MLATSSILPYPDLLAGLMTPLNIASMLPLVLEDGFAQLAITNREWRISVGLPLFFGPLNASTQPGMFAPLVLVAWAFPVPTSALPHFDMAWASFVLARLLLQI